jgi:hypothetical protein
LPTFFVGEEVFFGKDQLREVEEEITRASKRHRRAEPTDI